MRENTRPCPECKTPMELRNITLHFERNGFSADVNDVPAYICSVCGTEVIAGPTAEDVGHLVDHLFETASARPERLPFSSLSFQRSPA